MPDFFRITIAAQPREIFLGLISHTCEYNQTGYYAKQRAMR